MGNSNFQNPGIPLPNRCFKKAIDKSEDHKSTNTFSLLSLTKYVIHSSRPLLEMLQLDLLLIPTLSQWTLFYCNLLQQPNWIHMTVLRANSPWGSPHPLPLPQHPPQISGDTELDDLLNSRYYNYWTPFFNLAVYLEKR